MSEKSLSMEWQKKLYEQEMSPPADLWPSLAKQIQQEQGRLTSRLQEAEAAPPSHVWLQIAKSLPAAADRQPGILRSLYRYSIPAAAALLGLLLLKYAMLEGRFFSPATTSLQRLRIPLRTGQPIAPAPKPLQEPAARTAHPFSLHDAKPQHSRVLAREALSYPGSNYVEVCDVRQEVCRRINYKLEYMAACLPAQGASSYPIACRRELLTWLEQIDKSNYIPAPGHLFDIVELVSLLSSE